MSTAEGKETVQVRQCHVPCELQNPLHGEQGAVHGRHSLCGINERVNFK